MRGKIIVILGVMLACLAACGGEATPNTDAAQAVERYLQAKVAGDADGIRALLCDEKEADLQQESASFASVQASIEGMQCTRDGDSDVVRCSGEIVAVYGGENTVFPLRAYRVVQDDGVWKWCGETS